MKRTFYLAFAILNLATFLIVQSHPAMAYQVEGCTNLLLNGDMENDAGWQLAADALPSQYVPTAFSGSRSLLIGPDTEARAVEGEALSTARQSVTLPENVTTLSFWYWAQSGPDAGSDQQFAGLLGQNGELITLFLNTLEDSQEWQQLTVDLSEYAGQTVWVYFGVQNDGTGDLTRMRVDEVTLCAAAADGTSTTTTPAEPILISAETTSLAPAGSDVYTFEQLGYEETVLNGPFDSASFRLGLPASWELVDGVSVELHLTTLGTNVSMAAAAATATLDVSFNNVLISTTALQSGEDQRLTLTIPAAAVASRSPNSRHELELALDSSESCDVEQSVHLLVHTDSTFTLPYQAETPATDLRFFPQPIFQDSFLPETAVLVVPDQPSAADLQAAFTVAAGLGQLSNSDMNVSLLPVGQLTPAVQESFPLIFIGSPEAVPVLDQVTWPAPLSNGQFTVSELTSADGLLQLAVSPWNAATVVMSISGRSPEGLLKAAQAVSHGVIRVGQRPDLAVVTAVEPPMNAASPAVVDRSLADLGYVDQELDGRGRLTTEFEFTIPPGYIVGEEAFLELAFSHSTLLNYEQSGLTLRLNDRAIGSSRFEAGAANPQRIQIALPRSVVHTGVNHLSVRAEMVPSSECLSPNFDGVWLTLWSDSLLHLPLLPLAGGIPPRLDLDDFPVPFDNEPTLRDVAFVVPADEPVSWDTAARIAFSLGDKSNSSIVLLAAEFAGQVSPEFGMNHHLIVVGLPNDLPILSDMQAVMPAPFTASSNFADEQAMSVHYRLPADASVGYLELFSSPWSDDRAVLAVLGSTAQGLQWAGDSLTLPELRGQLSDNLAVIQDWQVIIGEQTIAAAKSPAPAIADAAAPLTTTAAIEATPSPVMVPDTTPPQQPGWMMPVLFGSGGLMGLIIIVVIITTARQRRRSHQ